MHPRPGAQISLAVDASESHVGSILQQLLDGSWAPLAFVSKKLSVAEHKYFVFDMELLAAYSSLRHYRFLLEGRAFTSACQQCHLAYLAEFTSSIVHNPGFKNVVADALSRPSPVPEPVPEPVPKPVSGSTASFLVSLPSSTVSPHVFSDPALSSYNFRCFSTLQLTCPSVSMMSFSPLFPKLLKHRLAGCLWTINNRAKEYYLSCFNLFHPPP